MTAFRDPTVTIWPRALEPNNVAIGIDRPATFGASPISGRPQMVVSSNGAWRISYSDVAFTPRNILVFRRLLAEIAGGLAPIYVGPYDYFNAPYRRARVSSPSLCKFNGGFPFKGDIQFGYTTSDCALAADAAEGATQIGITNSVTAPVSAGDYFELGGRLHLIRRIADNGSTTDIWPPLRTSYASGDRLEIDDPRVLAYLDPSSNALRPEMQFGQFGFATFEFIEARW